MTSVRYLGLPVLAALLLLVACGTRTGDDDRTIEVTPPVTADSGTTATTGAATDPTGGTTPPTTAPGATVDVAAGCASSGSVFPPGESTERTVAIDGADRTYLVYVPTSYEPGTAMPVIYNLHGFVTGALIQSRVSELDDKAEEEGFITVTPNGLGPDTIDGLGTLPYWNVSGSGEGADDLAFIDQLVDDMRTEVCVDNARTYVVGLSNGGHLATRLACERETTFAAVAAVDGVYRAAECGSPIPFLAFQGTDDTFVLYDGGLGDGLTQLNPPPELEGLLAAAYDGIDLAPVPEAMASWAERNGCDPEPVVDAVSDEVERWTWEGCTEPVIFYVVDGGGGTWPGSEVFAVISEAAGYTTFDINANDIIWDFFSQASL